MTAHTRNVVDDLRRIAASDDSEAMVLSPAACRELLRLLDAGLPHVEWDDYALSNGAVRRRLQVFLPGHVIEYANTYLGRFADEHRGKLDDAMRHTVGFELVRYLEEEQQRG